MAQDEERKIDSNEKKPDKNEKKDEKSIVELQVEELKANPKMMIDKASENVVKRPPPNQRCPCGSNKSYKKCPCSSTDKRRTEEFIAGAAKK